MANLLLQLVIVSLLLVILVNKRAEVQHQLTSKLDCEYFQERWPRNTVLRDLLSNQISPAPRSMITPLRN